MSRSAIDEILDLDLGEVSCNKLAQQVKDSLPIRFKDESWLKVRKVVKGDARAKDFKWGKKDKKSLLRLYYALELVREDVAAILDEIDPDDSPACE